MKKGGAFRRLHSFFVVETFVSAPKLNRGLKLLLGGGAAPLGLRRRHSGDSEGGLHRGAVVTVLAERLDVGGRGVVPLAVGVVGGRIAGHAGQLFLDLRLHERLDLGHLGGAEVADQGIVNGIGNALERLRLAAVELRLEPIGVLGRRPEALVGLGVALLDHRVLDLLLGAGGQGEVVVERIEQIDDVLRRLARGRLGSRADDVGGVPGGLLVRRVVLAVRLERFDDALHPDLTRDQPAVLIEDHGDSSTEGYDTFVEKNTRNLALGPPLEELWGLALLKSLGNGKLHNDFVHFFGPP